MHLLKKSTFIDLVGITFGVFLCVFSLNCFLMPAKIAPGGLSGVATIVYYLFKIPSWITLLMGNLPLFLLSIRHAGKSFTIRTCYALTLYSALAAVIPIVPLADEGVLSSVFGGILMGAGTGIVFRLGGSTGGSDLAAKLVSDAIRSVSVSTCLFVIDFAVIFTSGILLNLEAALYAMISLYITTRLVEFFTEGASRAKAFLIITDQKERIKTAIFEGLERGVSEFVGYGGYTGEEKGILLCLLENASEVVRLKDLIKREDERAFLIAWDIREVRGSGFGPKNRQLF